VGSFGPTELPASHGTGSLHFWWGVALVVTLVGMGTQSAQAQSTERSSLRSHGTYLGMNALTTGLASGTLAKLRGHSFRRGFAGGFLGGGVGYVGKRIASRRFTGSGVFGRQVAAVGHSLARNASTGDLQPFPIVFPLGPFRLAAGRPDGQLTIRVGVNVVDLAFVGYGVLASGLQLDWGRTLGAGAAVFVSTDRGLADSDGRVIGGVTFGGGIVLADAGPFDQESTAAHEMVHVIQNDAFELILSPEIDSWIGSKVSGNRIENLSLNSVRISLSMFLNGPPFLRNALEGEADFLERP